MGALFDANGQIAVGTLADPFLVLMRDPIVHAELRLSAAQRQAVHALADELDMPLWTLRNQSGQPAVQLFRKLNETAESRMNQILAAGQSKRLAQIRLSVSGLPVLLRDDIDLGKRPLEKGEWAGAVDNLGGDYLTWLTRTMNYGGNIASVGLAASAALNTTVLPFILRAVCLLGINSVDTPRDLRLAVWSRIGSDLKPRHLDTIGHRTVGFDELPGLFQAYIDGNVSGRTVVEMPNRGVS